MIRLGDLFEDLAFGPLNNLSIGGDGKGMVPSHMEARVLSYVNRALLDLYSKYILLEKELVVRVMTDRTSYHLTSDHADTANLPDCDGVPAPPCVLLVDKYIADTEDCPFEDDIIRILHVYDDDGVEVPINDSSDMYSVFTPAPDVLQIPDPYNKTAFFVAYQARHPIIDCCDCSQEIILPLGLKGALEAHISYQVFSSMNGQEHSAKAQEYYARYEMLCTDVEYKDLALTSMTQDNCKLFRRGFV